MPKKTMTYCRRGKGASLTKVAFDRALLGQESEYGGKILVVVLLATDGHTKGP